jgi:hypothetical protein
MPQISVKSLWQAADHPKKTGLYVFTSLFYGGADRRRKIDRLTVPVACRRPNFPAVSGAFMRLLPAAEPIFLRSGQRMPLILLRVEARDKIVTDLQRAIKI